MGTKYTIVVINAYFHLILNVKKEKVKFIYSEKATKFCEILTLFLSYVVPVKSKVEISQNFVTFSKYLNFNILQNISHPAFYNDNFMASINL